MDVVAKEWKEVMKERVTQPVLENNTQTLFVKEDNSLSLSLSPSLSPHLNHSDSDIVGAAVVGQFSDHLMQQRLHDRERNQLPVATEGPPHSENGKRTYHWTVVKQQLL